VNDLWDALAERPAFLDKDGKPLELLQWAALLEDPAYAIIARDTVGAYWVATDWLGHNMACGARKLRFARLRNEPRLVEAPRRAADVLRPVCLSRCVPYLAIPGYVIDSIIGPANPGQGRSGSFTMISWRLMTPGTCYENGVIAW
jgi:hypothetical protein